MTLDTAVRADLEAKRKTVERAIDAVHRLCDGERWTMRVPAEPERDHDLVIASALRVGVQALSEIETLRSRVAVLEDAIQYGDDAGRMAALRGIQEPPLVPHVALCGTDAAPHWHVFGSSYDSVETYETEAEARAALARGGYAMTDPGGAASPRTDPKMKRQIEMVNASLAGIRLKDYDPLWTRALRWFLFND